MGMDSEKSEEDVSKGTVLDFFVESKEVLDIVNNLKNVFDNQIELEISDERFTFIMDSYLEQPHLLDPHLENILNLLLETIKDKSSPPDLLYCTFKYMYILTKVRGAKVMTRLFPHEVADLEPIMTMLKNNDPQNHETWEMRYMLLLWLSMVCLIPFNMTKFDGALDPSGERRQPLMERIIETGKAYLINAADKCQEASAILLSKFFIRPDVYAKHTAQFMDWCLVTLNEAANCDRNMNSITKIRGILMVSSLIFKHGKRDDMLPFAKVVLTQVNEKGFLKEESNSLIRKYCIKLFQRLGTTFIKPKVASWRYHRGSRSLADTLKGESQKEKAQEHAEDEEEYDIPEEIEIIIEILLSSLSDGDTIVRWSGAKGIGRITGRLPKDLADEVVGSILNSFGDREDDNAWHGGCLTLAELGRRGLLLPRRLGVVVPILLDALQYDIKRGANSVGAQVRDSACYLAWSFARAYSPEVIKPYVEKIARGLLITTVFDREVNCRRAASAAFQENVGRQGQFPHGIDIVTTADYYAVGSRRNTYLKISAFIAKFEKYTTSLINHLVDMKVDHWDPEIRSLTAEALHVLTRFNPPFMAETILPKLVPLCTGMDLISRHGSILAVAEIVRALYDIEKKLPKYDGILSRNKQIKFILAICPKLWDAKLFRGFGGELMRITTCRLICKVSECRQLIPVPNYTSKYWLKIIHDSLSNLQSFTQSDEICSEAVAALAEFNHIEIDISTFSADEPQSSESSIEMYINMLSSNVERQRSGYSQVMGALPLKISKGKFMKVVGALKKCSEIISSADASFADARMNAITGISLLCATVGVQANGNQNDCICKDNIHYIFEIFFNGLQDHTKDKRGDIGSHVRGAGIKAIRKTVMLVLKNDPSLLDKELVEKIMVNIMQQCCEKIHKVRDMARDTLKLFLNSKTPLHDIPHQQELTQIFHPSKSFVYLKDFYAALGRVLTLNTYLYPTLSGLIVSVGDLTLSLSDASGQALCGYLDRIKQDEDKLNHFCDTFISVFKANTKSDRMSLPILKTLQIILIKNYFNLLAEKGDDKFANDLYELVKAEIFRSRNAQKVLDSVPVFCALLQFRNSDLQKKIIFRLMILLCHGFPVVRKATSGQLYEAVLVYEYLIPNPEHIDVVFSRLIETEWDQKVEEIRPIRNELCGYFNVTIPVTKKGA